VDAHNGGLEVQNRALEGLSLGVYHLDEEHDPDPHYIEKVDPDLHLSDANLQLWL
jgi:hypothetical protein